MTMHPAYFLAVALMVTPLPALAYDGDVEDQVACTPDVYRFCSKFVPNEDAIVTCLQQHKAQLSTACHAVFSRPDPRHGSDDSNN